MVYRALRYIMLRTFRIWYCNNLAGQEIIALEEFEKCTTKGAIWKKQRDFLVLFIIMQSKIKIFRLTILLL